MGDSSPISRTLVAISELPDDELMDRYLTVQLKESQDQIDRILLGLLKCEWNKRHPEDPILTAA